MVLSKILLTDRVRGLEIWQEFREAESICGENDYLQALCDEYGCRFANIVLSMEKIPTKPESERISELAAEGKVIEKVPGDGDCLIWCVLFGLRDLGFLPGMCAHVP